MQLLSKSSYSANYTWRNKTARHLHRTLLRTHVCISERSQYYPTGQFPIHITIRAKIMHCNTTLQNYIQRGAGEGACCCIRPAAPLSIAHLVRAHRVAHGQDPPCGEHHAVCAAAASGVPATRGERTRTHKNPEREGIQASQATTFSRGTGNDNDTAQPWPRCRTIRK